MASLVAILGGRSTSTTNAALVAAWRQASIDAVWLDPADAASGLGAGDVAIGRIDVLPSLDGVEPGLPELLRLQHAGIAVVNSSQALLVTHDKLATARRLAAAGVPHPPTSVVRAAAGPLPVQPPVVVKPRFGSWGADVHRCETVAAVRATLARLSSRPWFRRHGAVLQQLVPPLGYDLRVLVAAGRVVGAIRRRAAAGEWRTNYSLGGTLEPVVPPDDARAIAVAAAAAVDGDFVGVDLLPVEGGWIVLELNGAVDFEPSYAQPGRPDVYTAIAEALALPAGGEGELAGWGTRIYAVAGTSSATAVSTS
jgi:RimK family alpha-L-glutamate ligase